MHLIAPRNLFRCAGGPPLTFAFQRSSTLLTIRKPNKLFEDRLGAKGIEASWSLFDDVIPPMTGWGDRRHADVAAMPIFTPAADAKLTFYAREAPLPKADRR